MTPVRVAVLATVLFSAVGFAAETAPDAAEGRVLYTRYCAACHGLDADGHGPVAGVLRQPPSDLRHLAGRHGTPVVAGDVARFVDGRAAVTAHGPREMPVWGERFAAPEPEASGQAPTIDARIRRIVAYLQTIQEAEGARR